jgi:hypothetical protein
MLCTPAGRALINGVGPIDAANTAGWVLGLTGVAAGAVLLFLGRDGRPPGASIAPIALPGGGGLRVTGRF